MRIPNLGGVRRHEPWRFVGKVLGGTISRISDRWFLSVTVKIPDPPRICRENPAVEPIPKGMHIPWSESMRKTQRRIVRLHSRIANIRANALHQLTTGLVERFNVIAIEDLNV